MAKHSKLKDRKHIISEITSIISHQLKSPLSGIKSSLELILAGEVGPLVKQQREYLTLTLNQTEKLITIVKNVIDELLPLAQAKNSAISFRAGDHIPHIHIDPIKIHQVVYNIIDNAIHYNKGKGSIDVQLVKKGKYILFSCRDQGIGISKKEASKIFTKYFRSKQVMDILTDGTGLGLFISKAIIKKSGGNIWFESKLNKGTVFYFTLPVK